MADPGLLLGQAQPDRGEHRSDLDLQRLGLRLGAGHQHHEVVRVAHQAIQRFFAASAPSSVMVAGHHRLPCLGEVLVKGREGDVRQARRENAALRGAGLAAPDRAVLGEDPGDQERLDQTQHALVRDSSAHPIHQRRVRDLIEARGDVALQHPLVGESAEVVNLLDRVLRSAHRAEAVAARLEVRLEDRLEDQLEAGLHDTVARGRNPQPPQLARGLRDHPLAHRQRGEPARLEIVSQLAQELLAVLGADRAWLDAIDTGRSCSPIAPHAIPADRQEGRVADEVEQVTKPTIRAVGRPSVQLGLDPQYP